MGNRRDVFEAMKHKGALVLEGHSINSYAMGWGEPQNLSASCTCGWHAIGVDEPVGSEMLIPELQPFVSRYGKAALLLGDAVTGDWDTLAVQCIDHLLESSGTSLEMLLARKVIALQEMLRDIQTSVFGGSTTGLTELARSIELIRLAQDISDSTARPVLTPVSPEVIAEYRAILAAKYPS